MTAASAWWWAAGIAVALELFSGTVYLLMLAIGVAIGTIVVLMYVPILELATAIE